MGTSGLPRQLDKMVDQIVGSQTSQLDIYLDKFRSQIPHFIQSGGRGDPQDLHATMLDWKPGSHKMIVSCTEQTILSHGCPLGRILGM